MVTNDVEYAELVHEGTGPHTIRPRRPGGVLRFTAGGQVVFARSVQHPGTKAQPWAARGDGARSARIRVPGRAPLKTAPESLRVFRGRLLKTDDDFDFADAMQIFEYVCEEWSGGPTGSGGG